MSLEVLHVITQNQRRGAESAAVMLAEKLVERGLRSRVVALADAGVEAPLPVATLGTRTLAVSTLRALRREIAASDVVVAHGSRTLPAVAVAGAATRVPAVYQNIGDPLFWAGSHTRRLRVRLFLSRMQAVAALTEDARAVLRDEFGIPGERLVVCRNMRDSTWFTPTDEVGRAAARADLGLPADGPIVAVVGALSPEKRVGLAVESVARVPGAHLVIAGDGPERDELESLAAERLGERVTFTGSLPDVRPVLRAADTLLMTSASEGVPGVLVEAGLAGIPAVSSAVGYVHDVVDDGVTGELVGGDRPEAYAEALVRVLEQAHELGHAARARCVAHFEVTHVTNTWLSLLHRVHDEAGLATRPA